MLWKQEIKAAVLALLDLYVNKHARRSLCRDGPRTSLKRFCRIVNCALRWSKRACRCRIGPAQSLRLFNLSCSAQNAASITVQPFVMVLQ